MHENLININPKVYHLDQPENKSDLKLDFIGDIHGYANELENLLISLGYKPTNGIWMHPNRRAVFVGDFINRGPFNRRVIEIIRPMVEVGSGYAILGNHEINAICYFTLRKSKKPIQAPGPSNKKFLDKIKRDYINDLELFEDVIKWLRTLPLYINFGNVRVVHAYWSKNHIQTISKRLNGKTKLSKSFLKEVFAGGTLLSKAFMQTTKGVEFSFPPNIVVRENLRVRKISYRVKWWINPQNKTYAEIHYESKVDLPDIAVPKPYILPFEIYKSTEPPVFIGHYCMGNGDMIPAPNICCVDACAANGGHLAAYRWDGEKTLLHDKLVYFPPKVIQPNQLAGNA